MHDLTGIFVITLSTLDRKERCTAASEQVAESSDDHNDRKTESDRSKSRCADIRDTCNIDAIHDIIKQTQNLSDQHGQSRF